MEMVDERDKLITTGAVEVQDSRDYLAGDFLPVEVLTSTVPDEYELERLPKYKNQNGFPSCIAQTLATWIDYANRKEGVDSFASGRYIFAYCKALDGFPGLEGTFTRVALGVGIDTGTVENESYPERHDIPYAKYIELPPSDLKQWASKYKIKSYVTFEDDNQIKQYIVNEQLPVFIGINSNSTGWGYSVVENNNFILQEPTGSRTGHQVLCTGWNADGWIFENWWGKDWGDDGRAICPYNYSGLWANKFIPYDLPNYHKEINNMWRQIDVIKAEWPWLEAIGHPKINEADLNIHMKAKAPTEFNIGMIDVIKEFVNFVGPNKVEEFKQFKGWK